MYKQDFTVNNLQWLICYKTKRDHGLCRYFYRVTYTHILSELDLLGNEEKS